MRRNILRERLSANKPTLGTHLMSVWPTLVEIVGSNRYYDYVEFTFEYAPFTMHDLDNLGRALELSNLSGMIKIEQQQWTHQAMRAIGSGIQNALFADVRTVEDAKECVAAVRAEAPGKHGRHGVGLRRDVGTMLEVGKPAFVEALDEAVVAIMVEKAECVEDLDAILSVPGVDMVQFGPGDYAMGVGVAGQFNHPLVMAAERKVFECARKHGIHFRAEISDARAADRHLEMGVQHFCMGWDPLILNTWWRENGHAMSERLGVEREASAEIRGQVGNYQ
jgi:4-hydroxy-2-oxoheptanedioate aldolase